MVIAVGEIEHSAAHLMSVPLEPVTHLCICLPEVFTGQTDDRRTARGSITCLREVVHLAARKPSGRRIPVCVKNSVTEGRPVVAISRSAVCHRNLWQPTAHLGPRVPVGGANGEFVSNQLV